MQSNSLWLKWALSNIVFSYFISRCFTKVYSQSLNVLLFFLNKPSSCLYTYVLMYIIAHAHTWTHLTHRLQRKDVSILVLQSSKYSVKLSIRYFYLCSSPLNYFTFLSALKGKNVMPFNNIISETKLKNSSLVWPIPLRPPPPNILLLLWVPSALPFSGHILHQVRAQNFLQAHTNL